MIYFIVSIVANIISWLAGRPYAIIHDPWFEIPYTLAILGVPIFLLVFFIRRSRKRARQMPKQLVCPNGCKITQQGTNYCGLCGARMGWK